MRATAEVRTSSFGLKCFLNDVMGRLDPKSSEMDIFFSFIYLVVYLGHVIFHPVAVFIFLSSDQLLG